MNARRLAVAVLSLLLVTLAGCGGTTTPPPTPPAPLPTPSGSAIVLITDQPLEDLVKFEITVSSVVFNPGSVSALPLPKRLELTSLEMTTDFFHLAQNIPAGTYNSITLTFANPEIQFHNSGTGSIDEVEPPLQNSSVTVNVSFTVAQNQAAALLIDFDLRASVVTDMSGTITGINPVVTASVLDVNGLEDEIEDELGRVVSLNRTSATAGTFVFEPFSSCEQVTVTVDADTEFEDFAGANNFDSLMVDQIVEVDADLLADGTILAEKVELEDEAMEDELEGLIVAVTRDGVSDQVTQFEMVLFDVAPCTATLPAEDIFTVKVPPSGVQFRIDEDDLLVDASLFDDRSDLEVGQKVDVDPVEALGTDPVTAEKIKLEDQTIRGTVLSPDSTTFELEPSSDLFPDQSITVQTSVQTRFDDLPNGVASLSPGQGVRVKGLLFRTGADQQTLVAKRVDGTP